MAKIEQPVPGLFFDDLSKIRVLEFESAAQTSELKEECQDFIDSKLLTRPKWCTRGSYMP